MSATLAQGLSPVRTVLEGGAVVLVQEAGPTPAVAINATFLAGSVYEPDGSPGRAYLTGRVLDRGTARRSADVIAEQLDERGVALRVTVARHTLSVSCTCLAEDFGDVLGLVVDVVRRPTFPAVEVERQQAELITVLRQDQDNTSTRSVEALFELLYGADHPYGRPAKGTIPSVQQMNRTDLAAFHAAAIQPGTLTLAVVGDVHADQVLEQASVELAGWPGAAPGPAIVPVPPPATERRERLISMPGKSQTDIAYGFTAISRLDPRYYAYWIMNNIFGQFGLGGRLAENIRERQGMAYYAFSVFDPSVGEGPLLVRAGVDPNNVERALAAIDAEVEQLRAEGPTPAEVEQSREALIGSVPRMFETNHSIAMFLQTSEHFGLGLDHDRRLPGLLGAVTIEEVRAAAAEVLHPDRAAVTVAGPHEAA